MNEPNSTRSGDAKPIDMLGRAARQILFGKGHSIWVAGKDWHKEPHTDTWSEYTFHEIKIGGDIAPNLQQAMEAVLQQAEVPLDAIEFAYVEGNTHIRIREESFPEFAQKLALFGPGQLGR